ncbi:hypothetical protein JMJ35_006487 [Cladonia borealis]|uniref:BTB domain-containing protein n=1 Tax=Cladonia borealis TaxID=184061 RepID=A0AA39QZF5_9LECA|nr:hypothetical protein JMJ35_006487 [Cladonia borealis]
MDASNSANAPSETHAIAPTGDVILVVGEEKTELRVHSVCMRTASEVFDAMLGPHFSEGQPSDGLRPMMIPMPDDNATAMATICNVIHHRNDLLPDAPEPGELVEIALAADKYDFALALKYAMFQWLDFKAFDTFSNLGKLLIAAYVFDNSDAFRHATRRLITDFTLSYLLLVDTKFSEIIPSSIYYMLENARNRTRVSVQEVLLPDVAPCCDHSSESLEFYIQVLQDNDLWGASLFAVPIDTLVRKTETTDQLNSLDDDETRCTHRSPKQNNQKTRYSKLKELTASAGLCLGCVRSGNIDAKFPCDLDHKDEV